MYSNNSFVWETEWKSLLTENLLDMTVVENVQLMNKTFFESELFIHLGESIHKPGLNDLSSSSLTQ